MSIENAFDYMIADLSRVAITPSGVHVQLRFYSPDMSALIGIMTGQEHLLTAEDALGEWAVAV